jgi:serine/threonine-protein kinase
MFVSPMTTEGGRARARVGSVVAGKYRLVERLGGGGMGEVYRAENQYAGRTVALKLLRRDFAEDADLTRRFFQEAQAVNKIRHPNIVDVLDAGFCEEGPYVAMEILEGSSLSGALARIGRLDAPTALAVVLPMLDALDAAHRHGIVHRDLKPENVYLARTSGGVTVKLLDFGIAKVLDAGTNTNTGVVFGTPDYLSPEQASGEGVVDGRSDLFAVGIVLFELLTGKRPFEAPTAVATAYKIVHAAAPTMASLGVDADGRLQEALDVALAKDIEERFHNAAGFADMLAPLAPDGATRRAALVALVEALVGLQPTQAAPDLPDQTSEPPVFSPEPPRAAAPPAAPPPLAPRTPTPITRPAEPVQPAAPTLASTAYVAPRERTSSLRENVPSRAPPPVLTPRTTPVRPPASTPSSGSPAGVSSGKSAAGVSTKKRSIAWVPRPLPAQVRGKCHVRGSVPRAARRWIERTFGDELRDEVLRALPPSLADMYRADAFNALVGYEVESLDSFLEASTALLLGGDANRWRELAREHFDADFGPIFRSSTRTGDPATLLKRSAPTWTRLYDFATVRVGEATRQTGPQGAMRMVLRFEGFGAASLALRYLTIGIAEGLLKSAGTRDIAARVLAGEASFLRDFEVELAWP